MRRGVLLEDLGQTYLAEPDADGQEVRTLRPLQAAAVTCRIAFGPPRAGQKMLTLRGVMPRQDVARQRPAESGRGNGTCTSSMQFHAAPAGTTRPLGPRVDSGFRETIGNSSRHLSHAFEG